MKIAGITIANEGIIFYLCEVKGAVGRFISSNLHVASEFVI